MRLSNDNIPMLIKGMIRVIEIYIKGIIEDGFGLVKRDSMLRKISFCLFIIPLKFHERSIASFEIVWLR
jgi:hypothetical protein